MEDRRSPKNGSPGRKFSDRDRNTRPRGGDVRGSGDGNGVPRTDGRGLGTGSRRPGGGFPDGRGDGRGTRPGHRHGNRSPLDNKRGKPAGRYGDLEPEIKIISDLQITDGKLRGRFLKNSDSPIGVPTPRQIRETLFRLLSRRVRAGRFLDLCAGCGTIGLEALSRGAMLITFVERSGRMVSFLRKNLSEYNVRDGHSQVNEIEAIPFLVRAAARKRKWDVIYVGRPSEMQSEELIEVISRGRLVAPKGVIVIEHPAETPLPEELGMLRQWRSIAKDGTSLSFYNRKD